MSEKITIYNCLPNRLFDTEWCHNTATPGIEIGIQDTADYSVDIIIDIYRCQIQN